METKNETSVINNRYIILNDGTFYKKGTILIKHDGGFYAPSLNDYPIHCHFLTEEYISRMPLIFKTYGN